MRMLIEDLQAARARWWLFLALGLLLVLLSLLVLSEMAFFTRVTVLYVGFVLLIGGVLHVASAFSKLTISLLSRRVRQTSFVISSFTSPALTVRTGAGEASG